MKNCIETTEITTVCCVCGGHIRGPWPAVADVSHGYCPFHYRAAIREVRDFFILMNVDGGGAIHARLS